jgi:Arrestin (or S-antigen), N-terminal domain
VQVVKKTVARFLIFKLDVRLFKFRGDSIPRGQYRFPFTFKVPKKNVPSSFRFITESGECFAVKYTVEVYFKDGTPLMS